MTSATLPLSVPATVARTAWSDRLVRGGVVLVPGVLLIAGSVVGYAFTLDQRVAQERLLGLIIAVGLAFVAALALPGMRAPRAVLLLVAIAATIAGLWIIAVTGPDVFRGTVGSALAVLFRPLFGRLQLTDPVEIANTRFIIGYNGLADLCLVIVFACVAALLERRRVALIAVGLIALVVLIGTGSRGGLVGLAAGICAMGLYAWPRRYVVVLAIAAPLAAAALAVGALDKGLEFSSTAGRLSYWTVLARLLVEYPLTGVGLGVDTANTVALQHEINPDPERIFYAHNTFVQAYLEQGPLGMLGMLLIPVLGVAAALIARRYGLASGQRMLFLFGLGTLGALEAHGLTDQVVTTNVGTGLVLLALAAIVAALSSPSLARLVGLLGRLILVLGVFVILVLAGFVALPAGRAQALLNFGGLQANHALQLPAGSESRPAALAAAEATLNNALAQDAGHPAILRNLARVRAAHFDDIGALEALKTAAGSPHLDAFDQLQIAHLYRDAGFPQQAYALAARAYETWGRNTEDVVFRQYAENTLRDDEGGHRARILAQQAEAAMQARAFGQAAQLFQQALTFAPDNAYLQDRLGAATRAIDRYGPGESRTVE